MKKFSLLFVIFCPLLFAKETLNIYTYDAFTASWGPGDKVKSHFESQFPQCEIKFSSFSQSGAILTRATLEGKNLKGHILLGLDNFAILKKTDILIPHNVNLNKLSAHIKWSDPIFIPFEFAPFAFVYDKNKLKNPPKSLKELVSRQDIQIIYQDPRTSAPGRGMIVWMGLVFGDKLASAINQLKTHTLTVGKGWSETYSAFLKGQGDMVMSYGTSPVYHEYFDKKDNYGADVLEEGSLLSVGAAAMTKAVLKNDKIKACAQNFMETLLSKEMQEKIILTDAGLPVIDAKIHPLFDSVKNHVLGSKIIDAKNISERDIEGFIQVWQDQLLK